MATGSYVARRVASLLRPSIVDTGVCRSCQETLGRRNYAAAAGTSETTASPTTPPPSTSTFPVVKPVYIINAGVVLSRPPQVTRELEPFEQAYHFYQRRLNERQVLPFTKYFYFKQGTPADDDWKKKVQARQTAARDIGNYSAYSKNAWNDELLVGSVESETQHQIDTILNEAESTANAIAQDTSKREEIPRPFPRVTEADKTGDHKSLDRLLPRTLYLLVQSKEGYWKFPSSAVETGESLRLAAERTLEESAGVNMKTWTVGYHPAGHHVYNLRAPKLAQAAETEPRGNKTFFMKARIMAGQADLAANSQNLKDFKWLAKDEISQYVRPEYYSSIKNILPER